MLIGDVRPTTLDGVKRLAAQLRKERGLKYSVALDLAAKAANCTNFRNAKRTLPKRGTAPARAYVFLTIYWYDKEKGHRVGRETLKIELSKDILEICEKSALKNVRGFGNLRMVAADHFICDGLSQSRTHARKHLCTAERSLRFMEHTGLRPSRDYRKAYPNGSADDELPGRDHVTYWVDPASGQFILVDEPYARAPNEAERTAWTTRTGWQIIKTSWPGMYNPYHCDLFVVTNGRSNYDLDALVSKIDAMPAPLVETDWSGESSPSWETFVSPMAKTVQDVRRARCRGTIYPISSATTVPYSFGPGLTARRPAGKMGIDGHIEAGRIIKAVLRSNRSNYAIDGRMNSLRSTLENWMTLETSRGELEGREFFDIYYSEAEGDAPYREMVKSRSGIVAILGNLKRMLQAAYPDCAPLRKQLHRIDMSLSLIRKLRPADE